ncbi:MAG TPA: PTS sugar transporter subunit IIB [Desulfomonilia bacterium]|jgi:PTS system mannose-specific IIB component
MNIVLIRIDDRLIHGQILESWLPYLKAQCVVVANDTLAEDQFQMAILSMAVPERIKLRMVGVESVKDLSEDPELVNKTTLIIVSSVLDAYRIVQNGILARINLGNMRSSGADKQLMYSFWVNEDDITMLKEMMAQGISINLQSVPREKEIDIKHILDTLGE